MKRILTYGTFDLLHYGHIRLLKRARELGDYLIVALSTDEFNAIKGILAISLVVKLIKQQPATWLFFNKIVEYLGLNSPYVLFPVLSVVYVSSCP